MRFFQSLTRAKSLGVSPGAPPDPLPAGLTASERLVRTTKKNNTKTNAHLQRMLVFYGDRRKTKGEIYENPVPQTFGEGRRHHKHAAPPRGYLRFREKPSFRPANEQTNWHHVFATSCRFSGSYRCRNSSVWLQPRRCSGAARHWNHVLNAQRSSGTADSRPFGGSRVDKLGRAGGYPAHPMG